MFNSCFVLVHPPFLFFFSFGFVLDYRHMFFFFSLIPIVFMFHLRHIFFSPLVPSEITDTYTFVCSSCLPTLMILLVVLVHVFFLCVCSRSCFVPVHLPFVFFFLLSFRLRLPTHTIFFFFLFTDNYDFVSSSRSCFFFFLCVLSFLLGSCSTSVIY